MAIITGEASGDRVGGDLVRALRRLRPDWHYFGTGGKHLRDAGAELLVDSSRWGGIGVAEAATVLPRVLRAFAELKRTLLRRKPDLLIAVDAGGFHLGFAGIQGLCPWAREHLPETPILYYFPPGSWRRTVRHTTLAANADLVATPFPWSETELRRHGVNARFVGHPLLDLVKPELAPAQFASRFGIETEHPVVGILPGSRRAEIQYILPAQLHAAEIIRRRVPGVQFVVALAATVDAEMVRAQVERVQNEIKTRESAAVEARMQAWEAKTGMSGGRVPVAAGSPALPDELARRQKAWIQKAAGISEEPAGPLPLVLVPDLTYDVMAASDVLISASGTATLEAAILGKPMVILYKLSRWNLPQYWLVRKTLPPFIGLPNLLAERQIVPEFVQDAATPDALASSVIDFLLEPDRLLKTRESLAEVRAMLGEPGGAARTAQLAVELAEQGRGRKQS